MTLLNEQLNAYANMSMPRQKMQIPYGKIAAGVGGAAALYGANALMSGGNERWDRTAINTAANIAGGVPSYMLGMKTGGMPGAILGGLTGAAVNGYASDRIADMFDPTHGLVDANQLLNAHLENNPYKQEMIAREELKAAQDALKLRALQQRQMQEEQQIAEMQMRQAAFQ